MLDQRRAEQEGFITLKQAAEIANYSPDYVGQLIRAGKIRGEQVYSNLAWVTTEAEIRAYLADKQRVVPQEDEVPLYIRSASRYALYGVIGLCVGVMLFLQYVLYVSIDRNIQSHYATNSTAEASMTNSHT